MKRLATLALIICFASACKPQKSLNAPAALLDTGSSFMPAISDPDSYDIEMFFDQPSVAWRGSLLIADASHIPTEMKFIFDRVQLIPKNYPVAADIWSEGPKTLALAVSPSERIRSSPRHASDSVSADGVEPTKSPSLPSVSPDFEPDELKPQAQSAKPILPRETPARKSIARMTESDWEHGVEVENWPAGLDRTRAAPIWTEFAEFSSRAAYESARDAAKDLGAVTGSVGARFIQRGIAARKFDKQSVPRSIAHEQYIAFRAWRIRTLALRGIAAGRHSQQAVQEEALDAVREAKKPGARPMMVELHMQDDEAERRDISVTAGTSLGPLGGNIGGSLSSERATGKVRRMVIDTRPIPVLQ